MRAAAVGMVLVALLAFASDQSFGQQQPRRGLDNLLDDNQGITGPAQAVVPAANQLDVPAEAELKDADKQIKTAYEADYKGNPKLLAEKLNAAAYDTKETDDPASKYVLLLESQEAFMRAGDVDNAVQLLNFRGGLFKINMPVEKLKLIKEFPKPIGAIGKKLIDLSLKMTEQALEADQVEIAEDAVELALALARKSAGPDRLKTCALERTRVKERRVAFDECQTALAVLAKNLADQEANSVVGRYYSIDKHDWEKGLPYLIQGKQDSLQANATREQTLRQNKVPADNTIEQMFLLAGDWWTLSEETKVNDEKLAIGIKTHASDLYAELLPNLTNPVHKELARKRAADVIIRVPNENSIGMEFVEIPTKPFLLGKFEVTQSQFKKVMDAEPWRGRGNVVIGKDVAASYVDWDSAILFCKKLTESEREKRMLPKNEEYRLPTPEEWEYACLAGTQTAFSFGNNEKQLGYFGWFDGNTAAEQYAHKVGMKKPNPWGLYDMHGNVFEWCGSEAVPNPRVCGGSWSGNWGYCKLPNFWVRGRAGPASDGGFRVARSQLAQ